MKKRILIVGGVAGGASCATRARRLDEDAEIIIFERGSHVSFANCGLPYHVGNVIPDETSLIVAGNELFKKRFNIDVRLQSEVVGIDREAGEIEVRQLLIGKLYRQKYDALVLAPGAAPLRPPLPGVELPGIFVLRNIPDSRKIREWIERTNPKKAVVVGGGFVGLEMAENLTARGIKVTVVEMLNQLLPPLDPEMAAPIAEHLEAKGLRVRLGDGVTGFSAREKNGLVVVLKSGGKESADLVILAIGVRPENGLAKAAGLEIGERGGIRVDEQMRTSNPRIWAVGDAVEVRDAITGAWALIPLAGPANRQGRAAADSICGQATPFRGVQGSAICEVLGLAAAMTGASEKALKRAGVEDFEKVYLHPQQHAGYYPGARRMHLKLVYRKSDGRILGAQAVGEEGVDKRIDVISMAIQKGGSVFDLEEAELCYAPQFGAAKDPVNIAGMIAANSLRDGIRNTTWDSISENGFMLLDVRDREEFESGHVDGATNIPLADLRQRLHELPRLKAIRVYCGVGQRAYNAARLLRNKGFRVENVSGGYETYLNFRRVQKVDGQKKEHA
jgi:NADPH-dependent 2,4-dienoyl-CoA reductase/sulfur reductase-like enzyme/rhodanese-related sulfurtransferase